MFVESVVGGRRLTRAQSKAQTRERVLAAAARAFARDGYDGASVEEIAESAGYSVGAVYSNFSSKEHLFAELLADQRAERSARLAAALAEPGGRDERLAGLARLVVEFADGGGAMAAFGGDVGPRAFRDPELRRVVVERLRESGADLGSVVAGWLEHEGVVGPDELADAAEAMVALVLGLARRRRLSPDVVTERAIARSLGWLLDGMSR